jgi:hypothetical protein
MANRNAPRAKGICPECQRVISGRAVGPEQAAADRTYVALSPHTRNPLARSPQPCLSRGGRRVVRRLTPAELAALDAGTAGDAEAREEAGG